MTTEIESAHDGSRSLPSAASLPLPLTVFEQYLLLDDRPTHPMASFLEIDLSGEIDLGRLQLSLPKALDRHPLLKSLVKPDLQGKLQWVEWDEQILIQPLCPDEPVPEQLHFNLESEPGLRIWVQKNVEGMTVILYVHHATCDALGMLTFFMEWLTMAAGAGDQLPPDSLKQLLHREEFTGTKAAFPLRQRLRNITRYLFGQQPIALSLPKTRQPRKTDYNLSAYHVVRFSSDQLTALRQAAHQHNASLNDWLATALFQTLADWDREFRSGLSTHPWRVLIPVNRRSPAERFLSACNLLGYKMLSRKAGDISSFPKLLSCIRDEMTPVRRDPRGVYSFVKMLKLFDKLGLLTRTVRKYDCFATVILSNLGDLSSYFAPLQQLDRDKLTVGNVSIESIRCAPPRRPNTNVTIVALTYAGELHLISSRISSGLDDQQTLEFLNRFHGKILEPACESGTLQK